MAIPEAEDKTAEQPISHDSSVRLSRVKAGYFRKVEWPQSDAHDSSQNGFRKEYAEWLLAQIFQFDAFFVQWSLGRLE